MEDHLDVGVVLSEGGQHVGQQGGTPPGGHPDVEGGPLLVLEVPQVADQLPVQIALPLQIGVEHLPRRGELQRGVGAVQEHHAQIVFQLGQILAQVGLGQVEAFRCLGNAVFLHDGQEIFRIFHEHGTQLLIE